MQVSCIVQARMGSDRLPGKVLKPINGIPMIDYTLTRLQKSRYINQIILATSDKQEDDKLAAHAKMLGFDTVRGDENNVLSRYQLAAQTYGGNIIVRVTGDCPLIDPTIVDQCITRFQVSNLDYMNVGAAAFCRGIDTEVFSAGALNRCFDAVNAMAGHNDYKEHVTLYMYRHPNQFSCESVPPTQSSVRPYRLCVDTAEDFSLVETIYSHFKTMHVHYTDVISFLDNHPEIASINAHIEQKQYLNTGDEGQ